METELGLLIQPAVQCLWVSHLGWALLGFPSLMGHSLGHLDLQVLETCVKNCGHRFHVLVANQDFVENVLVRTILPKNNPPTIVHDKVLNLIQVCSLAG